MKIEELTGIEDFISNYPIFEYKLIDTKELMFEPRVRMICEQECTRYGTTWACPPATGTLEECRDRCLQYENGLFFSSVAEVSDIMNMEELLSTRDAHEEITHQLALWLQENHRKGFVLSTESCAICEECAYPEAPCRFPERMHPCIESHGIVVTELVEKYEMTYSLGGNTVLWFSLILF